MIDVAGLDVCLSEQLRKQAKQSDHGSGFGPRVLVALTSGPIPEAHVEKRYQKSKRWHGVITHIGAGCRPRYGDGGSHPWSTVFIEEVFRWTVPIHRDALG